MKLGEVKLYINRGDIRSYARQSFAVALPMSAITLMNFLINLTDVYIAGRIGKEVQAAYGFVSQFYFIIIVIASAMTIGTVSTVAQLYTSNKKEEFRNSVYSALVTVAFLGLVFTLPVLFLAPLLVEAMPVPGPVKEFGIPLIEIYAFSLLFHYSLINLNGILRSTDRIKYSLKTMSVVCVLNIILNFYFVFYTPLGYKGIAVSTLISIGVGTLLNLRPVIVLIRGPKKFSLSLIKRIGSVGWPMGIIQWGWQIANTVIFIILGLIPGRGVEIMAAFTNGLRIEMVIFLVVLAFNMSSAVIVGNLLGTGRKEDAYKSGLVTAGLGVIVASAIALFLALFAPCIASFLSNDPTVIYESTVYIYIAMLAIPFMSLTMILMGGLSGAGDTKVIMLIIVFSLWVVRLPLCYLFGVVLKWGPASIWWAMVLSLVVQALFVYKRYKGKAWFKYAM